MTTRATATVQGVADQWETLYPSAVFSGIVGDTEHAQRGGYHISIEDQTDPANYSVVRPDDKAPPGTWPRDCASAIDMNLALGDMETCHGRLVAVWRDRATDPRAKYINAHNGWNGSGNAGRYDWVTGSVSSASDDHKWHIHLEIRRRYVNDAQAAAAVLSILRGDSVTDYLGDDVSWEDDVITNPAWRADSATNRTVQAKFALYAAWDEAHKAGVKADAVAAKVDKALAQLAALAGMDFTDEAAIAQQVLAGLDPAIIAQVIPADLAARLADELAARLARTDTPA